jgi:hypothetical protein
MTAAARREKTTLGPEHRVEHPQLSGRLSLYRPIPAIVSAIAL